jgi:hypothetical protein
MVLQCIGQVYQTLPADTRQRCSQNSVFIKEVAIKKVTDVYCQVSQSG